MKATKTTPTINKLIARFDDELLNILLEDFRNFKVRRQFMYNNRKAAAQQTCKAA